MGAPLVTGAITTAPSASAVDGSGCTKNVRNHWRNVDVFDDYGWSAILRSGPGSNYRFKKGLLFNGNFKDYCGAYSLSGKFWYYVKLPSGTKDWVYGAFTDKGIH